MFNQLYYIQVQKKHDITSMEANAKIAFLILNDLLKYLISFMSIYMFGKQCLFVCPFTKQQKQQNFIIDAKSKRLN